jgi:hypothetical protein
MAKLAYHLAGKSVKAFNPCKMEKRKWHAEHISPVCYAPVKETELG